MEEGGHLASVVSDATLGYILLGKHLYKKRIVALSKKLLPSLSFGQFLFAKNHPLEVEVKKRNIDKFLPHIIQASVYTSPVNRHCQNR